MLKPETAGTGGFGVEHMDSLYRYALFLTRNRFEAEDVLQETYVRAINAFDGLREDSNVKGWLFTIMRTIWLHELRKRRTRPQMVDLDSKFPEGVPGQTLNTHEALENEEDTNRVRAAIAQLPPMFQEVLVLREYEELSYQEIAEVIGCPVGTVMSRLGRSRARLRLLLSSEKGSSARR
jgi:RNA polymerase sigma-70 factor (ECF subfamily)